MADPIRAAVIGGASPVVLSLLQALKGQAERWTAANTPVYLFLSDAAPARALRWSQHGLQLQEETGLPLYAGVAPGAESAVRDASVILVAEFDPEARQAFQDLQQKYGWLAALMQDPLTDRNEHESLAADGFAAAAEAASLWPACRKLGEAVRRLAPHALLLFNSGPTDLLAAAVQRATGCPAAGVSGDVEETRLWLGRRLDAPAEEMVLHHAGVRGDGWVTRFQIRGEDGYPALRRLLSSVQDCPELDPGDRSLFEAYREAGVLRCSPAPCGETRESAHSPGYSCAGEGIGRILERLLWARASGETEILPLQVTNHGSTSGFPAEGPVEIPVAAAGAMLQPLEVGPLPAPVAGRARLQSLQRQLLTDWLLDGRSESLLDALKLFPGAVEKAVLPEFAADLCRVVCQARVR